MTCSRVQGFIDTTMCGYGYAHLKWLRMVCGTSENEIFLPCFDKIHVIGAKKAPSSDQTSE